MFKVFALGFETCSISEALLVSDKHVPACQFQSMSPGTGVVFMQLE